MFNLFPGCATVRVTDPPRTATEQYLESQAIVKAVDQLSSAPLRDRKVYLESLYLTATTQPTQENSFMLGELRAKLLLAGVRLANRREDADIVLELRSGGVGVDRLEYLLGIPATVIPGSADATGTATIATPELAIFKTTKQYGFANIAIVAYWRDSGELVTSSGPFDGKTFRTDLWIFGFGPNSRGDIAPAERSH